MVLAANGVTDIAELRRLGLKSLSLPQVIELRQFQRPTSQAEGAETSFILHQVEEQCYRRVVFHSGPSPDKGKVSGKPPRAFRDAAT
jgi:hypothetical protein